MVNDKTYVIYIIAIKLKEEKIGQNVPVWFTFFT